MKTHRVLSLMLLTAGLCLHAQEVAVKTNLLYDATTTPNIGIEIGIGNKNTVQLTYGLNPWTFHTHQGDRKAMHWVAMPELRWWLCTKMNGHFFGLHLMGGQYNASNVNIPLPGFFFSGTNIVKAVRDTRCQGSFAGGGITYGYQWMLGQHCNVEAEIGVGYDRIWYDRYPCYMCGSKIDAGQSNYAGITKLGISFIYIF